MKREISYSIVKEISNTDSLVDEVVKLWNQVFDGANLVDTRKEFLKKRDLLFTLARCDGKLVGFKVGYEINPQIFFSWLGGTDLEFREQGIAAGLMRMQHEWCLKNDYKFIRTFTQNSSKRMLVLNLKNGFDIIGTYTEIDGEQKIMLQRCLT